MQGFRSVLSQHAVSDKSNNNNRYNFTIEILLSIFLIRTICFINIIIGFFILSASIRTASFYILEHARNGIWYIMWNTLILQKKNKKYTHKIKT